MTLDVEAPHPPDLTTGVGEGTSQGSPVLERRADLETMLHDSAWRGAFSEWRAHTDLSGTAWEIVLDLDLIQDFDFAWDPVAEQVRFTSPSISDDWRSADLHPDLESWSMVSAINNGLDELGRTVADLLENEYVDWDTQAESEERDRGRE